MPDRVMRWLRVVVSASFALGILSAWWLPAVSTDPGSPVLHLAIALIASYLGAWALALVWWQPHHAVIARCALVSSGVAATVVLLEAVAAVDLVNFAALFGNPIPEALQPWNRPDPELIHLHRPGAHLKGRRRGGDITFHRGAPPWRTYTWDVTMDDQGFRNPPGQGRAHYALIGDSFVEGIQVGASDVVGVVLQSATGRTVRSFGQAAYGPYQERAVLDRFVIPSRPSVVIWVFYEGNDLLDLGLYREATRDGAAFLAGLRSFPRRRMFTKNLLIALSDRLYAPARHHRARDAACACRPAGGSELSLYFLYGSGPLGDREMRDLAEFGEILRAAHDTLSAPAIPLVLAFVPTKFRVYQPYCRIPKGSPIAYWPVNDLPRRMEALTARISPDIVFADLTVPLRAAAAQGDLVYFPDDTHWSERGHRVAGDALARVLSAAGL